MSGTPKPNQKWLILSSILVNKCTRQKYLTQSPLVTRLHNNDYKHTYLVGTW